MPRLSKLEKITELKALPNVFESPEGLKGEWQEMIFENDNPIVLELGCGRGEYTVGMARIFPDKNFIGADIKGPRIWKGARMANNEGLENVAFVRTLIECITDYFAPHEVSEIWVTFPDPYPKASKSEKRLVSKRFLALYKEILKPGGIVHFKTDNTDLFNWAIDMFQQNPEVELLAYTDDLYHSPLHDELTDIKTYYEGIFLAEGKTIKYSKMRLA